MDTFVEVLTHRYATLRGRAGRREYWVFSLVFAGIWLLLRAVDDIAGLHLDADGERGAASTLFALALLLPLLAVGVRRLHDAGRSGWWLLAGLLPVVGPLAIAVLMLLPGHARSNRFGAVPAFPPDALATASR